MRNPGEARTEDLKDVVPDLCDFTDRLLYGEVWDRPGLSKRDRSLITIAALIAMYRPDQLREQFELGLDNGLTVEELGESLTHLAFYAAWPSANSAAYLFKEIVERRRAAAGDGA